MIFFTKAILLLILLNNAYAEYIYTIDDKTIKFIHKEYGEGAVRRMHSLISLLNKINAKDELKKVKHINDFFNKDVTYSSDEKAWGKKDYWASREEFLGIDEGDCEDYVIAKYFSLRQLGIPVDRIYLTYVKAIKYRQSHMVLTYYRTKGSVPLVLDNIVQEIEPATQRTDLRPLFSFNGEKIYMAKERGLGKVIPQGKINLSKWTDLVLKIKKEKR